MAIGIEKFFCLDDDLLSINFVGVLMTRKCPLKCRHCFVKKQNKDFPLKGLLTLIDKIAEQGEFNGIVLTGGEPFVVFDNLQKAVEFIKQKGLRSAVITSGFWASSKRKALSYLRSLKGLDVLGVSVDKYHQKQVPLKNIKNILKAAKEFQIKVLLMIMRSEGQKIDKYIKLANEYSCYYQVQGLSLQKIKVDQDLIADAEKNCSIDLKNEFCKAGMVTIDVNGDAFYCGCPAGAVGVRGNRFYLGNIYQGVVERDYNLRKRARIKRFIGQKGVVLLAKLKNAGVKLPGPYYSKCDICYDLITLNKRNKYLIRQIG
jgi:MoaA/NifB/PqqE/SkfB family radical SAM enzyme